MAFSIWWPGQNCSFRERHYRSTDTCFRMEILLIQGGTAHVSLGEQERDLHTGGLVFIPAKYMDKREEHWRHSDRVDVRLLGAGFEETMRCNSVASGETPTPITPEQQKECAHLGHSESAGRPDDSKK